MQIYLFNPKYIFLRDIVNIIEKLGIISDSVNGLRTVDNKMLEGTSRVGFHMNILVRNGEGGGYSYRGVQLTMRLHTLQKAFG